MTSNASEHGASDGNLYEPILSMGEEKSLAYDYNGGARTTKPTGNRTLEPLHRRSTAPLGLYREQVGAVDLTVIILIDMFSLKLSNKISLSRFQFRPLENARRANPFETVAFGRFVYRHYGPNNRSILEKVSRLRFKRRFNKWGLLGNNASTSRRGTDYHLLLHVIVSSRDFYRVGRASETQYSSEIGPITA